MTGMATTACSTAGVSTTQIEALKTFAFKTNGMIEDVAKLHMELVALAFACNFNRVVTMQWGDGTDATKYNVPTNATLGNWPFHHISHRVQSDGDVGNNATAEQAHVEIDRLRMETLKYGLDQFARAGCSTSRSSCGPTTWPTGRRTASATSRTSSRAAAAAT